MPKEVVKDLLELLRIQKSCEKMCYKAQALIPETIVKLVEDKESKIAILGLLDILHHRGSHLDNNVITEIVSSIEDLADKYGESGSESFLPSMIEILPNEEIGPNDRERMAKIIGKVGNITVLPALENMYSNKLISNRYVQDKVSEVITKLKNVPVPSSVEVSSPQRASESRSPERPQRDTPTTSSSEASSSRRASELRSPERGEGRGQQTRSEGESSTMEQMLDMMRRVMEPEWKTKEDKIRQEEQLKFQQEHNRTQEQLAKTQQERNQVQEERDQAREQLRGTEQERDQAREQLRGTEQERDQAREQLQEAWEKRNLALAEHILSQEQLTSAQQERDQAQEQLRKIQQEHNPTQEQLRQARQNLNRAKEQMSKAQQERNQAQQSLNRMREQLIIALQEHNSTQEQLTITQQELAQLQEQLRQGQQVDARDQSSRGELRANDALPTTVEGMEEQLEGERRRQQELFERVLRLQDGIQRALREHGENVPSNERLNELLRQGIWNLVGYHRLGEVLFPRQEFGELPSLRQRVHNFYLQTVSEYTSVGLAQGQIAGEFIDQLQDQLGVHNRPNQELIDTSEDVQELVTGRRPNRTPQRR